MIQLFVTYIFAWYYTVHIWTDYVYRIINKADTVGVLLESQAHTQLELLQAVKGEC